ncbi:isocitrate dehydrogenase [Phenylobacterium zucineum HLK1]|uniref:Isocitrate dehydrogenase n=1 Tax=Phenylobacterium zucineum (strain HLK1) TaxID=450851 RepID=B4RHE2_PHEZH|nr:VOC family protein [Phenylobacterium zucineum]ACG77402.1 isocitrate dehydrogenase [Phenylobacterium zucineum HLK1]
MTLGYVTLGAHDPEEATKFFDPTLGALGYEASRPFPGWVMYGPKGKDAILGICKPYDGKEPRAGNGNMLSFLASSKEQIQAAHAAALANGGTCEGPPGYRPSDATSGFYAAYFRDPVGNKLCAFLMD